MSEENLPAVDKEDEGRPPVDPKNKLYTVISLLIFAVLYAGWYFIKDNFTLTYALYADSLTESQMAQVMNELELSELPEGAELSYARMHRNFDSDTLYAEFRLPDGFTEDEDFAEALIPYEYGNVAEDERFTVYPTPDMNADFVYGDSYVCIDNPMKSCLIYEGDDGTYALFRTDDCDPSVKTAFKDGVKIPVKFSNQNLGR